MNPVDRGGSRTARAGTTARRISRRLIRIRSLGACFRATTNITGTISNIDFALSHNGALTVINRSNSKGSIASDSLVRLLPGANGVRNNDIVFSNGSVIRTSRTRLHRLHNGSVSVVFRSPVATLSPIFGINARVVRGVHLRSNLSGRTTHGHTVRVLGLIDVPGPRGHVSSCPCRLSNNVYRHIVVTVTVDYRPGFVVTSRPAATLSIAMRTRILDLLGNLRSALGANVLLVARGLNVI